MQRLLSIVLAFCAFTSLANEQAKCSSLKVAGAEQWRPFAYTTHSPTVSAQGIAHDVAKMIAQELHIPVIQQVEIPWKRIEMQLEQGLIDMLAGNYWTLEREKKWLLTDPIASERVHIFTLASNTFSFQTLDDLHSKSGVVPRGISLGADFDKARQTLKIIEVRNHEQMYDMVSAKRVDFLVSPLYAAQKYLKEEQYQNIVMLQTPINTYDVHLSLSRKSPCAALLPEINQLIRDKKRDGTIEDIVRHYTE